MRRQRVACGGIAGRLRHVRQRIGRRRRAPGRQQRRERQPTLRLGPLRRALRDPAQRLGGIRCAQHRRGAARPQPRRRVPRFLPERQTVGICRRSQVRRLERSRTFDQQIGRRTRRCGDLREPGAHARLGLCSGELVDHPTVAERLDRRNALDAVCLRQPLVLVDIDAREDETAVAGDCQPLENRAERLAGTAPWCPEVGDDGHLARALEDIAAEIALAGIDDEAAGCGAGR
jgi:hypothetical protein